MPRRRSPRVFCIEAYAPRLTDAPSARSLLDFLDAMGRGKGLYQRVHTFDQFYHVARKWCQKQYASYSIGYFGFHGTDGGLYLGRKHITLEELGIELQGRCAGRVIHFGSCSTLNESKREIEAFRRLTKARCVTGYTGYVVWFEVTAFETLLFGALTGYQRIDAADRYLRHNYRSLVRNLGFRMYYG